MVSFVNPLSLLLSLFFFGISVTNGSHWRYGEVSWKLVPGTTSMVEFTAEIAWRSDFIGGNTFYFGDGESIYMSPTECSSASGTAPCSSDTDSTTYYEELSITTDAAGESATLIRYIFYYNYTSLSTFTYGFDSCCRIGSLVVGANQGFDYYGTVSLLNGNTGSPVSGILPIVQFTNGVSTSIPIAPVDNDGDSVTCREATSTESGISDNSFYSVDPNTCIITISESGSVDDKWAAQVMMETSGGDKVPIDFIFEATDDTFEIPQCTLITSMNSGSYYQVNAGNTLIVEMEGTDNDSSLLSVDAVSLPTGAFITPSGDNNGEPVTIYFEWTPSDSQTGSFSASIRVSDSNSLSSVCIIPILVTDATPPPTSLPTPLPTPWTPSPTRSPTKRPTWSPTSPTWSPTPPSRSPTVAPTRCSERIYKKGDLCDISQRCDGFNSLSIYGDHSCDCRTPYGNDADSNCQVCHDDSQGDAGCRQCKQGYFRPIDDSFMCKQCQSVFGNECLHCADNQGCQQCAYGYNRVYDDDCHVFYCLHSSCPTWKPRPKPVASTAQPTPKPTDPELVTLIELGENGSPYSLSYIEPGLYIYGDGGYFGAFFLSGNGIVMLDAPVTFASGTIKSIVNSVNSNNEKIKYVVYSHHHLDHIGNVWEYIDENNTIDDISFICHKDAFNKLKESSDQGLIPECNVIIDVDDMTDSIFLQNTDDSDSDSIGGGKWSSSRGKGKSSSDDDEEDDCLTILSETGVLNVGNQVIEFDYFGTVHSHGNLWIYSNQQKFLMVVDFVGPGWIPFRFLTVAEDPGRYRLAHDIALDYYDFNYFTSSHVDKIGTPKDIELNRDFMDDLYEAAPRGLAEFDATTITSFEDRYDFAKQLQDGQSNKCAEILKTEPQYTSREWFKTLQGINAYLSDHCWWVQLDLFINMRR